MDSQSKEQLIQILVYILIPIVICLFALIVFLIYMHFKEKQKNARKKEELGNPNLTPSTVITNRQSIFNFMEFDDIEDSMIVQRNGERYLMVIACQGVNYDLMSGVEKNGVEEGFTQFLNTLRHPVQIYIQTRAINLESSLHVYREKVKEVEDKYFKMRDRFEKMKASGKYTDEQMQKAYFELTKQSNLYEYGNSVIQDTERMSLNKNILNKNYYIIVPYYSAEAGSDKLGKEEIRNIAFSELYTRCQSLISSISTCDVRGRILRTNEIIELLYMAYNRDEAEVFGLDRAIKSGFGEMYSRAEVVYDKKMRALDKEIEERGLEKAKQKLREAKSELQRQVEEKEDNIDDLIDEVAKMILEKNEPYIGTEAKDLAIEKLKETEEGGKADVQKTRGRKKATTA